MEYVRTSDAVQLVGLSRQELWRLVGRRVLSEPIVGSGGSRDRRWSVRELLALRRLREQRAELRRLEREAA